MALLLIGCSSTPPQATKIFTLDERALYLPADHFNKLSEILSSELTYIQTIAPAEFKTELLNSLKSLSFIHYQENNCSQGQVACAFADSPHTIFINKNFFEISKLEQFTSILHEATHLKQENFEHVKCYKKPEWGYECDEDLNSAYGIEYKYLLHKYINTKDEQSAQLLRRIFNRINKI